MNFDDFTRQLEIGAMGKVIRKEANQLAARAIVLEEESNNNNTDPITRIENTAELVMIGEMLKLLERMADNTINESKKYESK